MESMAKFIAFDFPVAQSLLRAIHNVIEALQSVSRRRNLADEEVGVPGCADPESSTLGKYIRNIEGPYEPGSTQ